MVVFASLLSYEQSILLKFIQTESTFIVLIK